jgi:FtsP/CotA-like multicopper oxidase with cupredoxin domain
MYHAHSRGQIEDGAYGPIIIRPKQGLAKTFHQINIDDVKALEDAEQDVQPIMLTDWRHRTSQQTWEDQLKTGVESAACMDSVLVNGRGGAECMSREDIDKFIHPAIAPVMKAWGLKLTDKGYDFTQVEQTDTNDDRCVPPEYYQITLGNTSAVNFSAIPPGVFEGCKPSHGSRAVITAPLDKKWMALDLISTAGIDTFAFSIDEHPMWVYAVDGHYIEPLKVDALDIANGDRYSVFIRLDKPKSNYGMRVASIAATQIIGTTAVLSYGGQYTPDRFKNSTEIVSSKPSIDLRGALLSSETQKFNESLQKSFPPQFPQPPPKADKTFIMHMGTRNTTYTWALNSTRPFPIELYTAEQPALYQRPQANTNDSLIMTTNNNTWVDLIFITQQLFSPPHTIHKHSNKAFVLGYGEGAFNYTTVEEAAAVMPQSFNFATPPYRDGFVVPASGLEPTWLAVRYHVVNPGAFMLHCHIQNHLSGGMAMTILDGVDEWPEVPEYCMN